MRRVLIPAALAAAAVATLASCTTLSYYSQAVGGHLELLRGAAPVDERIADPATPEPLRAKLERATVIRDFASRELALPENGSYRKYADLGRPYVVWNVFAAPEFSVEPKRSCFPFAGCVAYRGYFAREDAEREAALLRAQGYDVFVGGVPAYSTLGWFDDPLLNTFIAYPEPELARLIFHELAHQVAYVKDDTVFNESFAVAVEQAGVDRWLAAHGTADDRARYERMQGMKRDFVSLIGRYRERLAAFYAAPAPSEAAKRAGKAALFAEMRAEYERMKAEWGGFAGFDRYLAEPNNALLISISTYSALVPAFRALLAEEGDDLPRFYARVKALAAMEKPERDRQLAAMTAARITWLDAARAR